MSCGETAKNRDDACVLVIGSVMLDKYIYCDVHRIDQTAAVPIGHVRNVKTVIGGAGNTALNLAALGVPAGLVSATGFDMEALDVAQLLCEHPANKLAPVMPFIARHVDYITVHKTRLQDDHGHLMARFDVELDYPPDMTHILLAELERAIAWRRPAAVIISDYDKGVCTSKTLPLFQDRLERLDCPIIIDPVPAHSDLYRRRHVITPNLAEARAFTDTPYSTGTHAAVDLQRRGWNHVLVTAGAAGLHYMDQEQIAYPVNPVRSIALDTCGAGDSVVAGLAAALWRGLTLPESLWLANAAAGAVVAEAGTAVAWLHRIHAMLPSEDKVCDVEKLEKLVISAKAAGDTVGIINGVFDMFHCDHQAALVGASKYCDFLVVLVNSDASTKRLKGSDRPLVEQALRAELLAGMPNVGAVTIFDEETPASIIAKLSPDVLIKGGEYAETDTSGGRAVKDVGGQVVFLPYPKRITTTKIVERIQRRNDNHEGDAICFQEATDS